MHYHWKLYVYYHVGMWESCKVVLHVVIAIDIIHLKRMSGSENAFIIAGLLWGESPVDSLCKGPVDQICSDVFFIVSRNKSCVCCHRPDAYSQITYINYWYQVLPRFRLWSHIGSRIHILWTEITLARPNHIYWLIRRTKMFNCQIYIQQLYDNVDNSCAEFVNVTHLWLTYWNKHTL